MKVGTDGVLLGAWATGGSSVLDVGTGTGIIALMMAQRCPQARVTALDIDEGAARQALQNVAQSPFADRIEVLQKSMQEFGGANETNRANETNEAHGAHRAYGADGVLRR